MEAQVMRQKVLTMLFTSRNKKRLMIKVTLNIKKNIEINK